MQVRKVDIRLVPFIALIVLIIYFRPEKRKEATLTPTPLVFFFMGYDSFLFLVGRLFSMILPHDRITVSMNRAFRHIRIVVVL